MSSSGDKSFSSSFDLRSSSALEKSCCYSMSEVESEKWKGKASLIESQGDKVGETGKFDWSR